MINPTMITPKEKAKEMIDMHLKILNSHFRNEAKQCALISVEKLIKYMPGATDREFWEQVKQEIEAL
jgi:hypothetical protein